MFFNSEGVFAGVWGDLSEGRVIVYLSYIYNPLAELI